MEQNVFYEGSLEDAISLAIQESKMVLAFVDDGSEESKLWETELCTNESLQSPLEHYAVSLRLLKDSREAGFLEALFPIPKKPTIVIIQNGTLKEYIQAGTAKEDLVRRIAAILNTAAAGQSQQSAMTQPTPVAASSGHETDNLYDDNGDDQPQVDNSTIQAHNSQQTQESQESRVAKDSRDREKKNQQETVESNSSTNSAERTYAQEVRQRKVQAAEERRRILKRIEDDKQERKEREAREKKARQLLNGSQEGESSSSQTQPIPLSIRQPGGSRGEYANIQVRLFDGSTIRSRFKSDATLNAEVRKWIDEDRTDGNAPYTFRVVLSPLPNKAIEPAEEIQSLLTLGLAPSATLVLVPAKYSMAYPNSGGFIWRSLGVVLSIFGAGYGLLSGVFGGITGMIFGRRHAQQSGDEQIPLGDYRGLGSARNSRISGFQNPGDARRDTQLYNGNSLNFEPRRDDDENN
ncbi:uncharacterized protein F4807DRAFT_339752 [Annulohypoxylon truncatum]|uniref:uncharacterized protein n=1 Tax=Annulohypoxylon truncatum TaxID=327061 RepID=UPI0020079A78|nr:uncharacterized protein F4807DRAFT_339752 [Annulohypoxylon truncatum]KAI1212526.1 hypothetical protein F4807DRAFT_339752 [Annulohypoxylon truncatum]